jgi:hypothetical protein
MNTLKNTRSNARPNARVVEARKPRAMLITASALLLGAGALLYSAQARADGEPQRKQAVNAKGSHDGHKHSTDAAGKSGHAAIGQKANGSGVKLSATTPKNIAIGQATLVTLNFDAPNSDGAVAKVRVPAGVTVTRADGSALGDIALTRGQATKVDLLVNAQNDGMQFLDVTTTQAGRSSIQSVPLKVGSGTLVMKSNGNVITTPSGERIVSMPAK